MLTKSDIESKLDAEIISALEKLESMPDKTASAYGELVEHIAKLHKLKTEERPKRISPDTMLVVAANILGILWITRYERDNPLTTKSLGFIMKLR